MLDSVAEKHDFEFCKEELKKSSSLVSGPSFVDRRQLMVAQTLYLTQDSRSSLHIARRRTFRSRSSPGVVQERIACVRSDD